MAIQHMAAVAAGGADDDARRGSADGAATAGGDERPSNESGMTSATATPAGATPAVMSVQHSPAGLKAPPQPAPSTMLPFQPTSSIRSAATGGAGVVSEDAVIINSSGQNAVGVKDLGGVGHPVLPAHRRVVERLADMMQVCGRGLQHSVRAGLMVMLEQPHARLDSAPVCVCVTGGHVCVCVCVCVSCMCVNRSRLSWAP